MRIELVYGIPLFEGKPLFKDPNYKSKNFAGFLEDLDNDLDHAGLQGMEKGQMFTVTSGGGNNDGAIYLGISLKTLTDDYDALSVSASVLNQKNEEWQHQISAFDNWMDSEAGKYFQRLTGKHAEMLVVCDSD